MQTEKPECPNCGKSDKVEEASALDSWYCDHKHTTGRRLDGSVSYSGGHFFIVEKSKAEETVDE